MKTYVFDLPALAHFRVEAVNLKEALDALDCHARDTEIRFILNEEPQVEFINVITDFPTAAHLYEIEYDSEEEDAEAEDEYERAMAALKGLHTGINQTADSMPMRPTPVIDRKEVDETC